MKEKEEKRDVGLVVYSFGFKHGRPEDADMVFDVRFLANPYWEVHLRHMSGLDEPVAAYVVENEQGRTFLKLLEPLLLFIIDAGRAAGKKDLRLAVGCTGGRHRSVAIVEALARLLSAQGLCPSVFHRDLTKA